MSAARPTARGGRAAAVLALLVALGCIAAACEEPPAARRGLSAEHPGGSAATPQPAISASSQQHLAMSLPPSPKGPAGLVLATNVVQLDDKLELVGAPSAAALVQRAGVRLLDAGSEPRQLRRYPEVATAQALELALDIDMQVGGAQQPVPPLRAQLMFTPRAQGGWTLRLAGVSVTAAATAGAGGGRSGTAGEGGQAALAQRQATELLVRQLERASTTLEVRPDGMMRLPAPAALPSEIKQLWASIEEALREGLVRWPAEPIGAGARWRVFEQGFRAGVPVVRQREFTLTDSAAGALRIAQQVREVALDGGAHDPALPAEVTVLAVGGHSDGEAAMTLRAGEPFPQMLRSSLATRATVVIAAQPKHNDVAGDAQPSPPTLLVIRQKLVLRPVPR